MFLQRVYSTPHLPKSALLFNGRFSIRTLTLHLQWRAKEMGIKTEWSETHTSVVTTVETRRCSNTSPRTVGYNFVRHLEVYTRRCTYTRLYHQVQNCSPKFCCINGIQDESFSLTHEIPRISWNTILSCGQLYATGLILSHINPIHAFF